MWGYEILNQQQYHHSKTCFHETMTLRTTISDLFTVLEFIALKTYSEGVMRKKAI